MLHTFNPVKKDENFEETLKINRARQRITGFVNIFRFQDKDTNQYISYCPTFDISGYGETKVKALEMIKESVESFFKNLIELSTKNMEEELRGMGFHHQKNKTKEFSKAYVDRNGDLQEFNAVNNEVEHLQLQTA